MLIIICTNPKLPTSRVCDPPPPIEYSLSKITFHKHLNKCRVRVFSRPQNTAFGGFVCPLQPYTSWCNPWVGVWAVPGFPLPGGVQQAERGSARCTPHRLIFLVMGRSDPPVGPTSGWHPNQSTEHQKLHMSCNLSQRLTPIFIVIGPSDPLRPFG